MYLCPECKKIFKVQGEDKKVKCSNCKIPLVDMKYSIDEWEKLDKEKKSTIKEQISSSGSEFKSIENVRDDKQVIKHEDKSAETPSITHETSITCPDCGASVPARSKFCLECGHSFETNKVITNPKKLDERGLIYKSEIKSEKKSVQIATKSPKRSLFDGAINVSSTERTVKADGNYTGFATEPPKEVKEPVDPWPDGEFTKEDLLENNIPECLRDKKFTASSGKVLSASDFKRQKRSNKAVIRFLIVVISGEVLFLIWATAMKEKWPGDFLNTLYLLGFGCIGFQLFLLFINSGIRAVSSTNIDSAHEYFLNILNEAKDEYEKQVQEYEEYKRALADYYAKWRFPCATFYFKCNDKKIDLSNENVDEYSMKSAQRIADELVPSQVRGNISAYNPNNIVKYYLEGCSLSMQVKEGFIERESIRNEYEQGLKFKDCNPLTKRRIMISQRLEELNEMIDTEYKSWYSRHINMASVLNKGMSLYNRGLLTEREKDWAIHGGIANGIAGPAAGVATALNTMNENEAIRARNASTTSMLASMQIAYDNDVYKPSKKVQEAKVLQRKYQKFIDDFDKVITLSSPIGREIYNLLTINDIRVKNIKNAAEISCRVCFSSYGNEYRNMSVDGVLYGKLYHDSDYVGDFYVPFSEEGVNVGESVYLKGYCLKYIPGAKEYRVDFSDTENLMMIEKI